MVPGWKIYDQEDQERRLVDTQAAWDGAIFSVRADRVELQPGQEVVDRQYVEHPGSVAVVAMRPCPDDETENQILLLRQYRHAVKASLWELPAGLIESRDASIVEAAGRELCEEVGLQAQNWDQLLNFYASPGSSNERLTIMLATDLSDCETSFTRQAEEAEIVTEWVDLPTVTRLVLEGAFSNPGVVAGVLALHARVNEESSY